MRVAGAEEYCPPDEEPRDEGGGPTGGPGPPPGLYYTASNLGGVGEAWVKGNPEIEVHLIENFTQAYIDEFGPPSSQGNFSSCEAGQYTFIDSARRFDQNDEVWSGNVLIATNQELAGYTIDPDHPEEDERLLSALLWEDDNRKCELVTNIDMLANGTASIGSGTIGIGIGVAATVGGIASGQVPAIVAGVSFTIASAAVAIYTAFNFFPTNDDYLGRATIPEGQTGMSMTYTMAKEDGSTNGTIVLTTVK